MPRSPPGARWPGTAAGPVGAVEVLRCLGAALRRAGPGVVSVARGDSSLACPALQEFCEAEGLRYAFGSATNAVLERQTAHALQELLLSYHFDGQREPQVPRLEVLEDYQAGGWSRSRRVLCKREVTPQGWQRRLVVSNLSGHPRGRQRGFQVERGEVPEQPLDELKKGLDLGRLSASSLRANAYRLLRHLVAQGLVVGYREAAAQVAAVCRARVGTLRPRLWKVGAWGETQAGRLCFPVSASWPRQGLWRRVPEAVAGLVEGLGCRTAAPAAEARGVR